MKHKLFLLLIALLFFPASKAMADYALQVHLKDGSTQTFLIASHPNLTIVAGSLVIKAGDSEYECKLSQVDHYDFPSDIDPNGVESVKAGNMQMDGDRIHFSGLKANSKVAVYTTDGKSAYTGNADATGNATIPLGALTKGIYVVKTGNTSTKVIKK